MGIMHKRPVIGYDPGPTRISVNVVPLKNYSLPGSGFRGSLKPET